MRARETPPGAPQPLVRPAHVARVERITRTIMSSASVTRLFPALGGVNVLRQSAGSYDRSPDHKAILGATQQLANLYVACGMAGHGFMLAPMAGKVIAQLIAKGRSDIDVHKFRLSRFAEGDIEEETIVIG